MLPVEVRARNVRQWHELANQYFLELDCTAVRRDAFYCSALVSRFKDTLAAELHVSESRVHRRRVRAENSVTPYFKLFWQLSGESRIRQGRREAVLTRGTWSVYDTSREYTIESSEQSRALVLLVPQQASRTWTPAVQALAGSALPSRGIERIVLSSLTALLREPEPLDVDSQQALQDATLSLIERALLNRARELPDASCARAGLTLEQVQRHIRERLGDPELTVDSLAGDLSVSRRTIYNLFAASGMTPRAYIQQARLRRAQEMLEQKTWSGAPVADIAQFAGFADPAHFSRAFAARFGMPPGVWRARQLRGA